MANRRYNYHAQLPPCLLIEHTNIAKRRYNCHAQLPPFAPVANGSAKKVSDAVNEMKSGNFPARSGWISVECLKGRWYGSIRMVSETVEVSFDMG